MEPQPDPTPELTRRLDRCLYELAEKRDSEILTPEFRESFSRSRRRYNDLVEDLKDKKSFTFIMSEAPRRRIPNVVRANFYRLAISTGARVYMFALTADGQIAELEMEE